MNILLFYIILCTIALSLFIDNHFLTDLIRVLT